MGKNKKLKKLVMLHTLLWMMIGAGKKRKCEHFLTNNELIIRKGGKARKYSICAALGNFVLIVSYRNLSYLDEKMVY